PQDPAQVPPAVQQQPDPALDPNAPPNIEDTPEFKALKEQQEKEIEEAKEAFKQASLALEQAKIAQQQAKEAFKQSQQAALALQDSQEELEKAKELQESAKHALEVAQFMQPQGLNNLPPTPLVGDAPLFELLTPNTPKPIEIEAKFLASLENALNSDEKWKEQIYLCLQGVARLLMAFKSLKGFYELAQEQLAKANNTLESKSVFFNAQIDYLKELVTNYNRYFDEFNAVMNENNALINQNFTVVLDQIELVKKLLARANSEGKSLLAYQKSIELLLAKLNSMEDVKNQLLELNTKSRAFIEQIKELLAEAITSIKENQEQAINHINTQEQESVTNLLALQANIEMALNELEEQGLKRIKEHMALVDAQIAQFDTDYTKRFEQIQAHLREVIKIRDFLKMLEQSMIKEADAKLATMRQVGQQQLDDYNNNAQQQTRLFDNNARISQQAYNANATQAQQDYTNNAAQLTQDFNTNATTQQDAYNLNATQKLDTINKANQQATIEIEALARTQLDAYNANAQQKTDDYNDNATDKMAHYDLNSQNKLDDYNNNAQTKLTEHKIELNNLADDLGAKLAITGTPLHTELAALKTLLEELRQKQDRFGLNFQVINIANNRNWTPPVDSIYYYVFIQGGHTNMGSNLQGGITSFSNLLSAAGGFNGQRGECKAGWFNLQAATNYTISVASGGICLISYGTRI
ncbi:coiled-coil domain-containing protein, partial [Helicobacter bizzozeronii]|uniref:hypothetical protein n=1 Tax=Helicobacter bizzozeronii TaxID=56877 RepID=UPI0013159C0A